MVPVLIFALSVTILVIVASVRGNLFQASLLTGDGGVTVGSGSLFTAPSLASGTGSSLTEFPIFQERTKVYRTALLGEDESNKIGFYFPHIYTFNSAGEGLVAVAFKPDTDLLVQKSLRLTMTYPGKVMKYTGETMVSGSGSTITVDTSQQNTLIVELTPNQGQVLSFDSEVSPFLTLPMQVTNVNSLLPNTGLQLRIINAESVSFDNTTSKVAYAAAPVDILYYTPAEDVTTRRIPTSEARLPTERGVLTMEMKPTPTRPDNEPVSSTTTTGVQSAGTTTPTTNGNANIQAFRTPIVTQDQTRVSPPLIREKSRETVYVYLSVTDSDGQSDIQAVEMDLSGFGLANRVPLVQTSTGPKYTVFGGSFILPDSVTARTQAYDIPYKITDGGSNVVQGSLKFVVRPALTEDDATTATGVNTNLMGGVTGASLLNTNSNTTKKSGLPSNLDIETDLNGDGKVDDTDLSIYLFTFNLERD